MPPRRPLEDHEIRTVLEYLNSQGDLRDAVLFLLGVRTGLRIRELLSLRVRDVTLPDGRISDRLVIERKYVKRKTGGREIPLAADVQAMLAQYLASRPECKPGDWLFPSRKYPNRPLCTRSAWRLLKRAFRACNLPEPTGTHSMRKTFAVTIYKLSGNDIYLTQQALGHADITTTVRYLSTTRERLREILMEYIQEVVNGQDQKG